jgi:MFS transporter, CP family, cyanate transporter
MKKQPSWFVGLGIVVIGLILRIPFTTILTVLSTIAADLNVSVSSLGMVTTIPLLMFALCSSLAPSVARKVGLERLFALILLVMTLGSAIRIINLPFLYLGTLLIGGSISFLNVLLPSAVSAYFPDKIGPLTTAYTTSMGIASALMSTIAVPMVKVTSWRFLIIFLSAGILLALLVWLPNLRNQERFDGKAKPLVSSVWSNKRAWIILLFGGAQSLLFYTGMTWLPHYGDRSRAQSDDSRLVSRTVFLDWSPLVCLDSYLGHQVIANQAPVGHARFHTSWLSRRYAFTFSKLVCPLLDFG